MRTKLSKSPRSKTGKAKTFYPLVGSLVDYQKNLARILAAIHERQPSRDEAIRWMSDEYQASSEFCRKMLDMLTRVGLMARIHKQYQITQEGLTYLGSREPDVLVSLFNDRVLGFREIIDTLAEAETTQRTTLLAKWRSKVGITFPTRQFDHRLNWLRALGYADIVGRRYFLTGNGLRLLAKMKEASAPTPEKQTEVRHSDVIEKVSIIGEFFEFQTAKQPSINAVLPSYVLKLAEGERVLDCLWVRYVHFGGRLKFPIEVHLGGNLADTLDRLETVSEYVQKAIIITDPEQEKRIVDRLKVKKSRLLDKLVVVAIEDVYKAVEATTVLKSFTTQIFGD